VTMPIILTVVSTALILIVFAIAFFVRRGIVIRNSLDGSSMSRWRPVTIVLFVIWLIFVLNTHILGFVYPFTGLMFVSFGFGILLIIVPWWIGATLTISEHPFIGPHKAFKAFSIISLPQQFCIGVIGAVANEWFLWETQFWWGIAALVFLLFGGIFLTITLLDMYWSMEGEEIQKTKGDPVVEEERNYEHVIPMGVVPSRNDRASSVSSRSGSSSSSTKKPSEKVPSHAIEVEPTPHVVQPSQVVQPSNVIAAPPQDYVFQPTPQEHVIQPQPMYYGNPSDVPPPPKDGGAFASPSPMDVYENPSKYMADRDSSDPARHMLKRAIKVAGIEMNSTKESQVYATIMELLQAYNLTAVITRDDGEAATLRNNLATDIAKELKLYNNDSMDELSYGLKEAILLWKEENRL